MRMFKFLVDKQDKDVDEILKNIFLILLIVFFLGELAYQFGKSVGEAMQ